MLNFTPTTLQQTAESPSTMKDSISCKKHCHCRNERILTWKPCLSLHHKISLVSRSSSVLSSVMIKAKHTTQYHAAFTGETVHSAKLCCIQGGAQTLSTSCWTYHDSILTEVCCKLYRLGLCFHACGYFVVTSLIGAMYINTKLILYCITESDETEHEKTLDDINDMVHFQ